MVNQKGYLLLEASIAMILACLGATTLYYTVGQTQKIDDKIERRVDRAYAWHVFKTTSRNQVLVHDHLYKKTSGKNIIDKTDNKEYEVQ